MTIISEPNHIFQTELNQTHSEPNQSFFQKLNGNLKNLFHTSLLAMPRVTEQAKTVKY